MPHNMYCRLPLAYVMDPQYTFAVFNIKSY